MNRQYKPVPCEIYGNYELAILRRSTLRFCWYARGSLMRLQSAVPTNIRIRSGGEFVVLKLRNDCKIVLRLDRIVRARLLTCL